MTNPIRPIAVVLTMLFFVSPVIAQNSAPSKPANEVTIDTSVNSIFLEQLKASMVVDFDSTAVPQDKLTEAILQLLKETGAANVGASFAKNILKMQSEDASGRIPAEFYDLLLADLERGQANKWMINSIVRTYRSKFTIAEIKELIAFYRTPLGKKLVAALPDIMNETMVEGEKIGRYVGVKIFYQMALDGKVKL